MGFLGLEKIIDSLKKNTKYNEIFVNVPLRELKFVVDGDQLVLTFLSWYHDGIYGGNYDKLFDNFVRFLNQMQSFIQIVIFNGTKKSEKQIIEELKKKILRLANFDSDENYFLFLKEFNSLFSNFVLIEALIDVGIDYTMTAENDVYGVACYANGNNAINGFFTVLSKNSYFNVYYIEKGYVSWKYLDDIFKDFSKINQDQQVPVFYLKNLLAYVRLSIKSWFYFCILLGNHDLELLKNIKFFKKHKFDLKTRNYFKTFEYFQKNETSLIKNGFSEIRNTYDSCSIIQIDRLIDKIEFKAIKVEYLTSLNQNLNDFDQFANNIKKFMKVFFPCLIENFRHEPSVFAPCLEINYLCYVLIKEKFNQVNYVTEYFRKKNPTKEFQMDERLIKIGSLDENFLYRFLKKQSGISVINMKIDILSLFYTALCLSTRFLKDKWSEYSTERIRDTLLTNLMIINFKIYDYKLNEIFEEDSNDINIIFCYKLNEKDQLRVKELAEKYDQIIDDALFDTNYYIEKEIEEVHLINQFQAFYYSLGLLNKLAGFNLFFLSPHRFLNGKFFAKFLREKDKPSTKSFEIKEMIEEMPSVLNFKNILMRKFDKFYQDLESQEYEINDEKSNDLSDLLKNIKI